MIRRTLHGRRFADYAVARYTLTVVGPAVTGRAGGGEGKSAVNRLGAVREEGWITSLIRRTLHGRRFADYAVARYTLTAVGPAVTGRVGGGEGKSAVNGPGAVREEGRIIQRNGRFHGPAV